MKRKLLATLMGAAVLGMVLIFALGQGAANPAAAKAGAISGGMVTIGVMNGMSGLYSDITEPGSVEAARMAVQDFGGKLLAGPHSSQ